jgi:Rieske 2Fe-2S family protein
MQFYLTSSENMRDTRSIRELIACQKPGWSLEQRFYTDPEIYALELDSIITCNWIFAGHQSQLAGAGDYLVHNVANESAIVVRGSDGEIRAFANVCRHRGSIVCLEKSGNTRKFQCARHAERLRQGESRPAQGAGRDRPRPDLRQFL